MKIIIKAHDYKTAVIKKELVFPTDSKWTYNDFLNNFNNFRSPKNQIVCFYESNGTKIPKKDLVGKYSEIYVDINHQSPEKLYDGDVLNTTSYL